MDRDPPAFTAHEQSKGAGLSRIRLGAHGQDALSGVWNSLRARRVQVNRLW